MLNFKHFVVFVIAKLRFTLTILSFTVLGTVVYGEEIKLSCKSLEPDYKFPDGELIFNTSLKAARFANWSLAPSIVWDNKKIVWANFSEVNGGVAIIFYYDRDEDLLQIRGISGQSDFGEYAQKYGIEDTAYPYRCRRRSF